MTRTPVLLLALAVSGAAWGATQPLNRIVVSEGYRHFGILFWTSTLGVVALALLCLARGRSLPLRTGDLALYVVVALIGTVLPGISSYTAAIHLPAGLLSILLSSIPMLAFPIALAMGNDHFRWRRLLGLALGFAGVALLVLPEASLPDRAQAAWIPVALISSAFYALEGNVVARWGTRGLDPVQLLLGATIASMLITLPLAIATGQFIDPRGPWGAPDGAILASAVLHVVAYSLYLWLVGQAGSVFAVQVSYFVTLFGIVWAMTFLDERYTGYIWAALAMMLAGLFFVQPRPRGMLASDPPVGQSAP
ncbi:MAG: DMT family transporter [Roseivivax sp.]|nr:DMT family transporter [Roseivivax sp.]